MTRYVHWQDIDRVEGSQEPVAVWVPSESVICQTVDVPPVPSRKWQAMIPWLMEDQLLDRPEDMTFVTAKADGRRVPVIATASATIAAWQQRIDELDIPVTALVPDFFALPWRQGEISIVVSGGRCLLRHSEYAGAAGPVTLLMSLLDNLQAGEQLMPVLYGDSDAVVLPNALGSRTEMRTFAHLFDRPPSGHLAVIVREPTRVAPKIPLPVAIAATLAGLTAMALAFGSWQETRHIRQQADYFEDQLRRGYRQYFGQPYDFEMADFQRVVSSQLEGQSGSGGLTSQLLAMTGVLEQCRDCELQKLSFDRGQLRAVVTGDAVASKLDRVAGVEIETGEGNWRLTLSSGVAQ
jgi:general secretion pathway protein L